MKGIAVLILVLFNQANWAQKPSLMYAVGHSAQTPFIKFSREGDFLLSCSDDLTAKLWDTRSGQLIYTLAGHLNAVTHGDIHVQTQKIVTVARNDQTAIVWSLATGEMLYKIKDLVYKWNPVCAFSPDGKYILLETVKNEIIIWDVDKEIILKKITTKSAFVENFKFSPDGRFFAAGLYDGSILVCNTATGVVTNSFSPYKNAVESLDFSEDGNYLAASGSDSLVYVWNLIDGKAIYQLPHASARIFTVAFSHHSKLLLTTATGGLATLWDVASGKKKTTLQGHKNFIEAGSFSPDDRYILTTGYYSSILWDAESGKPLQEYPNKMGYRNSSKFSNNGSLFASVNKDFTIPVYETKTGLQRFVLGSQSVKINGFDFSPDEKSIYVITSDSLVSELNIANGHVTNILKSKAEDIWSIAAIPEGKNLLLGSKFNNQIFDLETGRSKGKIYAGDVWINTGGFSKSGGKCIYYNYSRLVTIVETETGIVLDTFTVNNHIASAQLSPDGNYLAVALWDNTAKLFDLQDHGTLVNTFIGHTFWLNTVRFSADGTRLVTAGQDNKTIIWNIESGKAEFVLNSHAAKVTYAEFNKSGSRVVSCSDDKKIIISDAGNGLAEKTFIGHSGMVKKAMFAWDDQLVVSLSSDKKVFIWSVKDGVKLASFDGESFKISPSGKLLAVQNQSNIHTINLETLKLHYTTVFLSNGEFLNIDSLGYYDGSERARSELYFTCGTEIIELNQLKDQLWVPNLAERKMNGETIHAKTLEQLSICGLTPGVEDISNNNESYHFKIKPGRGGLGETILYVNGIEAIKYQPGQLTKTGSVYELIIKKESLASYFVSGKVNPVTVKAYTSDNAISSRGIFVREDKTKETTAPPNLYAVMVGVSDYKGDELDLKYAAKDATDVSTAVAAAARKLLNTDSKEHVFMYNLTTAKERFQLPEKNSIRKVLEDIGKKATANDILLIFFAGHGVATGEADKKQFYFLTADASSLSSADAVKDVGISTVELTEWMRPQNIKAQKRILIFDACNSGQAIKDFVKVGNEDQNYVAARNDDQSQQIKAIDKLNEKSGLFILSASASNQNAYEMGRYSQGLLTYALLSAIKQQPDILDEGKYLNVGRWFNAAEKTVSELSKESGARQEPQIVSNTNFNIGLVDAEVLSKIILPQEKPLFAASNFQNSDEAIADDDLELSKLINLQLNEWSARGGDSKLVYVTATNAPDAYMLTGRYEVKGDELMMKVNIKQGKEIKYRFETKGSKANLKALAERVSQQAIEWVAGNK